MIWLRERAFCSSLPSTNFLGAAQIGHLFGTPAEWGAATCDRRVVRRPCIAWNLFQSNPRDGRGASPLVRTLHGVEKRLRLYGRCVCVSLVNLWERGSRLRFAFLKLLAPPIPSPLLRSSALPPPTKQEDSSDGSAPSSANYNEIRHCIV